jgi:hypothetical protein
MADGGIMETVTTAGAGAAITAPLWIDTVNPYIQFTAGFLAVVWLAVQIFYKIKNKGLS